MHRLKKGVLIVFEGVDGAGKSTQARLLYERLSKAQFEAELSKEPTEGTWGKKLRKLIEEGRGDVGPQKELEWFIKDRFQHVEEIIKPGLKIDFVGKMKYAIIFSVILTKSKKPAPWLGPFFLSAPLCGSRWGLSISRRWPHPARSLPQISTVFRT